MKPFVRWLYHQYPDGLPDNFPHGLPDYVNLPREYSINRKDDKMPEHREQPHPVMAFLTKAELEARQTGPNPDQTAAPIAHTRHADQYRQPEADMTEPHEPLHLVSAHMTEAEYEERRKMPELAGAVYLQGRTNYAGAPFNEAHIPEFLWDAAETAGLLPQEIRRRKSRHTESYDCRQWPFELKTQLLDEAASLWVPPSEANASEWARGEREAKEFFDHYPELRQVFALPPEEIARQWRENNPA